jgi:hypothetical protein
MLSALFWIAVGAFVGWNLPQPEFAKKIQVNLQEFSNKIFNDIF